MGKHLVIALLITTALSCGQNAPLANYEPKSNEEQTLKRILLEFQDGVNTLDLNKIENTIHENASLMVGRDRNILSKAKYIKDLPKRLAGNPTIALGKPKMKVSGDKAEVKIYMTRGGYKALIVFNMKLDENNWYIQSWKY
jgi:hypothetical protein